MKPLLLLAAALTAVHVALSLGGAAEHTGVLAGQPLSEASAVLGPAYVVSYLAFVVVVPVFVLAAGLEALVRRREAIDGKARSGADP